ncbi:MAG: hypothetical protein ABIP39_13670 [Polyangiaceae bacterium]
MTYEAQLAKFSNANLFDLADDDGDDDATIILDLTRRANPAAASAHALPQHWQRHFWVSPESAPVAISWKAEELSATTQRIILPRASWRSSPSSWKARLAAVAMLGFLVSAIAAIALMTQA